MVQQSRRIFRLFIGGGQVHVPRYKKHCFNFFVNKLKQKFNTLLLQEPIHF